MRTSPAPFTPGPFRIEVIVGERGDVAAIYRSEDGKESEVARFSHAGLLTTHGGTAEGRGW